MFLDIKLAIKKHFIDMKAFLNIYNIMYFQIKYIKVPSKKEVNVSTIIKVKETYNLVGKRNISIKERIKLGYCSIGKLLGALL